MPFLSVNYLNLFMRYLGPKNGKTLEKSKCFLRKAQTASVPSCIERTAQNAHTVGAVLFLNEKNKRGTI